MTQAELAATAGLTAATVSRCVNGHLANYTTIRKLARALTITPLLLGGEGIIGSQREAAIGSPTVAASDSGSSTSAAPIAL
jgi:transcriptional regulator with XRE-family HTH domain